MRKVRTIVLCADDFGLTEAVDRGIVALIEGGRITATGCMVAGPAFEADAAALRPWVDRIDIGLHFALTDLAPSAPIASLDPEGAAAPLGRVLARALTGRIAYEEITAEIGRQVDRFRAAFGRDPDFIDGHQHVHVLPGVRRGLFAAFERGILDARRTWVRDCRDGVGAIVARGVEVPKALFIAALASGFGAAARRRGITVNEGFGGITAFRPEAFPEVFPKFLASLGRRPLVMCHPAAPEGPSDPGDPIAAARRAEFAHLSSETFLRQLEAAGVRPGRMSEVVGGREGAGE